MLHHGLVGADVHAVHTPGLEAIVSAGSCADGPQADPPVHATDVGPAVLGAQRPVGKREGGVTHHHAAQGASACCFWCHASSGDSKPCIFQMSLGQSTIWVRSSRGANEDNCGALKGNL